MKATPDNVGTYIRNLREEKNMPLRRLAAALDIDTSTLAKMEKGQRTFSLNMAPILAEALEIDFKELQITLLAAMILEEHGDEEFASEGLKMAVKQLAKSK